VFRSSILFTVAIALVLAWIATSFALRLYGTDTPDPHPRVAVVFTGQFDRINEGIRLLAEGRVERLFISGVNAGAGLDSATFSRQFKLPPALEESLAAGHISLATEAQDTIENALETACWLAQDSGIRSVLLITSHLHMPRASLVLERASGVRVERLPVSADEVDASALLSPEFWRFAGTWFMTLLPPRHWLARSGFSCKPA
jgi:uncharacterized SAM-binding protein YcdF (DUF218 family)